MARPTVLCAVVLLALCAASMTSGRTSATRRPRVTTPRRSGVTRATPTPTRRTTRLTTVRVPRPTPSRSGATRATRRSPTRTAKPTRKPRITYYMDSASQCTNSQIQRIRTSQGDNYIGAWSDPPATTSTRSCTFKFQSYRNENLKFKFTRLSITDCTIKIKIYKGATDIGKPDYTYDCRNAISATTYRTSSNGYVTIKLENPSYIRGFDFTFYVKSDSKYRASGHEMFSSAKWVVLAALTLHVWIGLAQ